MQLLQKIQNLSKRTTAEWDAVCTKCRKFDMSTADKTEGGKIYSRVFRITNATTVPLEL